MKPENPEAGLGTQNQTKKCTGLAIILGRKSCRPAIPYKMSTKVREVRRHKMRQWNRHCTIYFYLHIF